MPPKFANLKPGEIIRALERAGFYVHETHGSHVQMKHPDKPGRITIPHHTRFDVPKHIARSIVRQAGLTNAGFLELLKRQTEERIPLHNLLRRGQQIGIDSQETSTVGEGLFLIAADKP